MSLRSKVIRLAYNKPNLRPELLPLLKQAMPPPVGRTEQAVRQAIRQAPVGKKVGGDLYVHRRSFEKGGFGPVLEGMLKQALVYQPSKYTILKFSPKNGGMVSFLLYPAFDTEAHPGLESYQTVTLETEKVSVGAYGNLQKSWILHRKETMVDPGYPNRAMFETLTRAEENVGLLSRPPGKKETWEKLLADRGYKIEGHQLKKSVS